jgi:diphosphomevalonate decarboxylase
MLDEVVTAIGTPNIALIKYWGKRDEKLILPTNSSISITLDEQLNTKTSVLFSKKLKKDKFYINGELQDINDMDVAERFVMVDTLKAMAKSDAHVLVVSENSFPTASGLASSASGIATLTYAASKALDLHISPRELSVIARRGSGSACRSIFGGIVKWNKGEKKDGSDSDAEQIVNEKYWPDLTDVVAIVSESKKKVPSRAGMRQTVENSILYKSRLGYVEDAAKSLEVAIRKKDFASVAEITMRDSDNMHATMLDTWPPIMYLNDYSKEIIYKIHELNESEGRPVAAYTFDAGPNANIITTERNAKKVLDTLEGMDFVKRVIRLKAGSGPRLLKESESLISKNMRIE